MARTSSTTRPLDPDPTDWEVTAVAWLEAKSRYEAEKKVMDSYRADLMAYLEQHGEVDENGHAYADLSNQVGKWVGLQRQRRVTDTFDEEAALALLKEKGLEDRCIKMVPQVDQDAVYACLYEELLDEDDLYVMFPPKITYALVAVKA